MQFSSEYTDFCPLVGRSVRITSYAEAEAGGYGCAVELDGIAYECELENTCLTCKSSECLLANKYHEK